MANLQFLGGAGTVTGSRFLVDNGKVRFMVDCGMFQGLKRLRELNWQAFPIPPSSVAHVILTHGHIDHIGMLPAFVRGGFRGGVWCTPATVEICRISLRDSAHLQEEDARFANKAGFSKHKPALPLYTTGDAERAIDLIRPVSYETDLALDGDVRVRFRDAGHILGSGIVEAELPVQGKRVRLVFSGDLGRYDMPLLRDPSPVESADYVIIESTYGNRVHPTEERQHQLAEIIRETAARGGTLVVPAFALGRTQTLLYSIRGLKESGQVPDLPVYLDSPMAVDVTELFCKHIEEFDDEARAIFQSSGFCPLLCPNLHFVRTVAQSKDLNSLRYPGIIISASGMATAGRILHHLKQRLPDPRTTVLFMGFQAQGTRGQLIKDGAKTIKIHGEDIPVRAQIRSMESYSAHADANELLRWLSSFRRPPLRTFVVHGEPQASAALAEKIRSQLGWNAHIPQYLETVALDPP